jgi:hypothetical protein
VTEAQPAPATPKSALLAVALMVAGLASGCATQSTCMSARQLAEENSPKPVPVAPRDALRLAEAFVATHPGAEILLGSGGSMLPLYADHTVLVVQRMEMTELRPGMTVIFTGTRGHPIAHTLVENTSRGWIAMGLSNEEPDQTRVQARNYLGTVVKAYEPRFGPAPVVLASR